MTENGEQLQQEHLIDFLATAALDFQLPLEDAPAAMEALLFAAGDPLPIDKIQKITGLERQVLENILAAMIDRYARDRQHGLMLREIDGSWLLCTKPGQAEILQRLFAPRHRPPLSQAAYETLAIIAYNQPVTRAQVEAVRGVNSDSIIGRLAERNLIGEAGTLDAPGRPILFSTTGQFLLDFGLRSVKDLPPMEMLMYGTLRDFEETLEEAAGRHKDNQMTIDQLVHTFLPVLPAAAPIDQLADQSDADSAMADAEVLQLSGALFGEDPAEPDDDII